MFTRSVSPEQAPDQATYLNIDFEGGDPVALDGEQLSPATLLARLNKARLAQAAACLRRHPVPRKFRSLFLRVFVLFVCPAACQWLGKVMESSRMSPCSCAVLREAFQASSALLRCGRGIARQPCIARTALWAGQ
jgi:hypothetical protein